MLDGRARPLGVSRIRRTATKRRSLALAAAHAGTCDTGLFKGREEGVIMLRVTTICMFVAVGVLLGNNSIAPLVAGHVVVRMPVPFLHKLTIAQAL